jgi:hypothetical protein
LGRNPNVTDWTPRYAVAKQPWVEGPPIDDDEPVIVVRAQDVLAVEFMDWYMGRYEVQANPDPAVRDELLAHRAALIEWRKAHPERIKVADR